MKSSNRSLWSIIVFCSACLLSCEPEIPPVDPPAPNPCVQTIFIDSLSEAPGAIPLVVKVSCLTSAPSNVWVEFKVKGADEFQRSSMAVQDSATTIPLFGLMADTTYYYRFVAGDANCSFSSSIDSFTTGSIDPMYSPVTTWGEIPPSIGGYIMVNKQLIPGCVLILNEAGKTVWYHCFGKPVTACQLTPEGHVVALVGNDELVEVDLEGNVIADLLQGVADFDRTLHHEAWMNELGQFVTFTTQTDTFDLSPIGGGTAVEVTGDRVIVLDRGGNLVWDWCVFDVLDPATDTSVLSNPTDWLHANSVQPTPDGNYVISFRYPSQVWKIDAVTGEVIWKLGKNGDFDMPWGSEFIRQHYAIYDEEGNLNLFDNGVYPDRPFSRGLVFELDETAMTARMKKNIMLPVEFFSNKMSSMVPLPGNYFLFASSDGQTILITDEPGNVLWYAGFPSLPYRALHLPALQPKIF